MAYAAPALSVLAPRNADGLNLLLIVGACAAAHVFPFHLLIFSYAVLGPAHYLTEISWLHDRGYFTTRRWVPILFAALTILLIAGPSFPDSAAIWFAAILTAAVASQTDNSWAILGGLLGGAVSGDFAARHFGGLAVLIVSLVPTVIHVYVFTALFMLVGARRSGSPVAAASLLALLVGGATFLVSGWTRPDDAAPDFLQSLALYLQQLMPGETSMPQIFGFLSFAYTYHYLNWFSKAEVIQWHRVPRRRLIVIGVLYGGALAAYAFSFALGFKIMLALSVGHVLLELPLNIRSLRSLLAN